MIGLDTNVLVRHFVKDDAGQSRRVARLFDDVLTTETPAFVSVVTVVELVWVLESAYALSATQVAAMIDELLAMTVLEIQYAEAVFEAKAALADGSGDFADALIAQLDWEAGCDSTLTFDRKALRLGGFTLVP